MNIKTRIDIERKVVRKIVTDAIGLGYFISVNDGEETTVARSRDVKEIMAAVQTTDEDFLVFSKVLVGMSCGWVYLVYGNDGYDVVNDYTTNIEDIMAGANALAEKLEGQYA